MQKRVAYHRIRFPGRRPHYNVAVHTFVPAPVTVLNYYSGGFANIQRLTRGIGWVSAWILFLLG